MLEVKQHLSHLLIRQFIAGFHSAQGLVPTIQEHESSPVSINNVSGQRLALMVISEYVKESFFKAGLRYPGYNKIEEHENRCFTHARNRGRAKEVGRVTGEAYWKGAVEEGRVQERGG